MKHITKNQVHDLPINIIIYDTFLKRFKGLMFCFKPIQNEGILLTPCDSIHMLFMFFAIDVVFLNDKNQIVYVKENVKPWTVIFPIKKAKSTLEIPVGTIHTYSLQIGDIIEV